MWFAHNVHVSSRIYHCSYLQKFRVSAYVWWKPASGWMDLADNMEGNHLTLPCIEMPGNNICMCKWALSLHSCRRDCQIDQTGVKATLNQSLQLDITDTVHEIGHYTNFIINQERTWCLISAVSIYQHSRFLLTAKLLTQLFSGGMVTWR